MNASIIPNSSTVEENDPDRFSYASFWVRFWALTIDSTLLFFVFAIFSILFAIFSGVGRIVAWPFSFFSFEWQGGFVSLGLIKMTLVGWFYFALMESSGWQATVGKKLFRLCVVTEGGDRITLRRATLRFFAKGVSTFIFFLGFIMAMFTSKHQALHDMIAETLVIRKY